MTKKKHGKVKKPSKLIKTPKYQSIAAVVVIVAAVILGYFLFIASHAASPSVSGEAENGTLSGTACKVTSTGASGGASNNAVQFGGTACTGGGGTGGTPGHPLLGFGDGTWSQSETTDDASILGVTAQAMDVFACGSTSTTYPTQSACGTSYAFDPSSLTWLVAVGNMSESQATAFGNELIANGHSNADIRIMWEMNQDVSGWFQDWNQLTFKTAASYISAFQAEVTGFRAAGGSAGNNFSYTWCVNGQDGTSNLASGRTQFDTYPGSAYVTNVGVDYYEGNTSNATTTLNSVIAFAQSATAGNKPLELDEWGVNNSSGDTSFVNTISSIVHNPANNFALESYFSWDGSPDSVIFGSSAQSTYTKDFAGE